MNSYFDTSAFVKLFINEQGSDNVRAYWDESKMVCSSQIVVLETVSALSRARQMKRITGEEFKRSMVNLRDLEDEIYSLSVDAQVINMACNFATNEGLRAYDALHLASAVSTSADVFVCADLKLCAAAISRGLAVFNPEAN
jgi:hypothetical protein